MKKNLLVLNFLSIAVMASAQETWKPITANGMGDVKNIAFSQFFSFKGKLFSSTQRAQGNPPAQMWYAASGDSATWTKVTSYTPALTNSDINMISGGTTDSSGGLAFVSTVNNMLGTAVYSSADGINWTKINTAGFGSPANYRTSPTICVFKDSLYAATWNANGGQIWRCHSANTNPANWKKMLDFATVDNTVRDLTYLYIWNNTLYVGTVGAVGGGGHIYQSDNGSTWSKNTGVGDGFGIPANNVIASMANYNGYLYAGLYNPTSGGQLWRTPDGKIWSQITGNAFGKGSVIRELKRLCVAGGNLWVSGNPSGLTGDIVWRSSDGINFVQSNTDGFGDVNNSSFPMVAAYNNYVYYGGQNTTKGGQIWRACVKPVAAFKSKNDTAICLGTTFAFTNRSLYASSFTWKENGLVFSNLATPQRTYNKAGVYTLTLIAANGTCTDSAFFKLTVNGVKPVITQKADSLISSAALSYQWFYKAAAISGATLKFIRPNTTGYYSVKTVSSPNCQLASDSVQFLITALSASPDKVSSTLEVFPNPVSENSLIKLYLESAMEVKLELYDSKGRKVATLPQNIQNTGTHVIAFNPAEAGFSKGLYFVVLKEQGNVLSKKIIVVQ